VTGLVYYGGFLALAAWPFYSAYQLVRHYRRGTPLSRAGLYGLYVGGFPWLLILFVPAALNDSLKVLIGVPFFVAAALTVVWNRRMTPPRGPWATAAAAGTLVFCGLLAYMFFGGGEFDAVVQAAHAQARLQSAGYSDRDPAGLESALFDQDPYVRYGATIALRRLAADAPALRGALTEALVSGDDRTSGEASRFFVGPEAGLPSPEVLGPLLDSDDAEARARVNKGLNALGPDKKAETLAAVARWRTETSSGPATSSPRP
jgi:hypothetical protein